MPRGRGHRGNLLEIGTELNIVPYLDIMTVIVMFLLLTITSFLSFTMLNASIPQVAPEASTVAVPDVSKGESLLLIVRVTEKGFEVDPSVTGGKTIDRISIPKNGNEYDFERLKKAAVDIKTRFPKETRVLIISEPKVVYDNIIHSMDALREQKDGEGDLFSDVTLSIL